MVGLGGRPGRKIRGSAELSDSILLSTLKFHSLQLFLYQAIM